MQKILALVFVISIGLFLYAYHSDNETKSNPSYTEHINGIDVTILNNLSQDLVNHPKQGLISFSSNTKWQEGMRSVTSFSEYKKNGKIVHENRRLSLQGDESSHVGGSDTAPGAIEELMYATGTCIASAASAKAALMGVKLNKIVVSQETDIDLHGFLALDPNVRPGVLNWKTQIQIGGDASEEMLQRIAQWAYEYSPVSDTMRNGVKQANKPTIIVEN